MPRYCDIVMKGGITSGIVYPAAVAEIAKSYVFKKWAVVNFVLSAPRAFEHRWRKRALDAVMKPAHRPV